MVLNEKLNKPNNSRAGRFSVAFVSHSADMGGAERSLLDIIDDTVRCGAYVYVVLNGSGPMEQELLKRNVFYEIMNFPMWINVNKSEVNNVQRLISENALRLVLRLNKINPDIIFTNTSVINEGALAAKILGIPHIWNISEFGKEEHGVRYILDEAERMKFMNEYSDKIFFVSRALKNYYKGKVDEAKMIIMPNMVRINEIAESKTFFRLKGSHKMVLIGNIIKGKGQKDAVLAVKELLKKEENIELILAGNIGNKEYYNEIQKIIEDEKMQNNVRFIGYVNNSAELIKQSDIVLVCATNEGFGRVAVEGMLLKKPIIGANSGGTTELITDGLNGFLYESGDHKQLANKIEYFIKHNKDLEKMGQNGYEFVINNFNEKMYLEKLLKEFTELKKIKKEKIFPLKTMEDVIRSIDQGKKELAQKELEIQRKEQEISQKDQELFEIRTSLRWKIPNYFYKLYKNKIKKYVPKSVFRLKDIALFVFYKIVFNLKKLGSMSFKKPIFKRSPLVTIGIASYNHSKYLKKCIESALNQSYKKIEVVIIDDNSSDPKNREILKEYENNPKVKIIYNKENQGISDSLNSQVINASGDWVAFMDCDDYLPENAILEMVRHMRKNPQLKLIYSNRIEVDENDKFLRKVWFGARALNKNVFNELLKGMVSSHLKIIHKDAFRKIGLFDPRFGGTHDYDFFLRMAFYMPKAFGFIDKYLYYHRIHSQQNTVVDNEKHNKNVEIILKEARFRQNIYSGEFKKKVSIVILSFNRYEQLKNTIENVVKYSKNINNEIIIWDNGSTYEKLLDYLKKVDGKNNVRVIFSETNLMAAEGRKRATELADGDYILYFDNDIEVEKNFLEELIVRIEESDDIASCCAKVVFPDGKIQYTGGLTNKLGEKFISFSLDNVGKDEDSLLSMQKMDYDWLGSGATMTKRKYLHLANFDSGFINAYEDNDYYMQFKENGLRLVHAPMVKVIHHHVKYEVMRDPGTKKYVETRHKKDSFIESWVHFYKKWDLIVMDDFILGITGLADKKKSEIIAYLENNQK